MDQLLENNFYLFMVVIFIISFSIVGIMVGVMCIIQDCSEGEPISFKKTIITIIKAIFFIILLGFVFGTISWLSSYILCEMGVRPVDLPENLYY